MSFLKCNNCGSLKKKNSKGSSRSINNCSDCTRKFPDNAVDKIVQEFWGNV